MDYCFKGQWVMHKPSARIGRIDRIITRRSLGHAGSVVVQFGAGGPYEELSMAHLRETSAREYKTKVGIVPDQN